MSSSWPVKGREGMPPGILRSGRASHTGHARWNNSRNTPHRSRCCWLEKDRSSQWPSPLAMPTVLLQGHHTHDLLSHTLEVYGQNSSHRESKSDPVKVRAASCSHSGLLRSIQAPESGENANRSPEEVLVFTCKEPLQPSPQRNHLMGGQSNRQAKP